MPAAAPPPPPGQSAVIPYRIRDGRVEVLLVTTRSSRGRSTWIVPKGNVEPALGPARSAEREAYEEAGARGTLSEQPFGHYRHGHGLAATHVDVYLLHVETEMTTWPEEGQRRRRWVAAGDAARVVRIKGLGLLLGLAATTLAPSAPVHPWDADAETPGDIPAWPPLHTAAG